MTPEQRLDDVPELAHELRSLRDAMLASERAQRGRIESTHPRHRRSAANLVHYVSFRQHDVRRLQSRLSAMGLSSLGRSEAHVLASVEAVLDVLDRLAGQTAEQRESPAISLGEGDFLLAANADDLLGPQAPHRLARIMVTMPSSAADDSRLVDDLVDAGMDLARVNCAHDDPAAWKQMISNVRSRSDPPLVAMDLAGPKLRTGSLPSGPAVLKVKPNRSVLGEVVDPALIRLVSAQDPRLDDHAPTLAVDDAAWLLRRRKGDLLELVDTRGAQRTWTVADTDADGCVIASDKTTYFTNGTTLTCPTDACGANASVTGIAPSEPRHVVVLGDHIVLTRSPDAPDDTDIHNDGQTVVVGCTLPELFDAARPGEAIWFDDGKIGCTIEDVTPDHLTARVTNVAPRGAKLQSAKGINVPETSLSIAALTDKDLHDLDFVAQHADLVNLSFVRHPSDIEQLQQELERRGSAHVGIVLKIENVTAFENLPQLLLTAMRTERVGVMIARGDLAVEVGFARLAEVQEEILWACEAAHVPVIWATQVLESLAKTGRASRAEVTDAAMSVRAECVMLNKGPHILDAISALDSILSRMGAHHRKKRSMLRRLTSWDSHLDRASS